MRIRRGVGGGGIVTCHIARHSSSHPIHHITSHVLAMFLCGHEVKLAPMATIDAMLVKMGKKASKVKQAKKDDKVNAICDHLGIESPGAAAAKAAAQAAQNEAAERAAAERAAAEHAASKPRPSEYAASQYAAAQYGPA